MRTHCTSCVHCPYGPSEDPDPRIWSRTCPKGHRVEEAVSLGRLSESNPDLCPDFEKKNPGAALMFIDPDPGPEFDIKEVNRFTKVLNGMVI